MPVRFVGIFMLLALTCGRCAEGHPGHGADGGSQHWNHYVTSPYHLVAAFLLCSAGWLVYRVAKRAVNSSADVNRVDESVTLPFSQVDE